MRTHCTALLTGSLLLGLLSCSLAGEKNVVITDPAKAGPDYAVQGEYLGALASGDDKQKHGAQVIARGGSKFQLVLYTGGLPGAGWQRGDEKQTADGKRKDKVTTFRAGEWSATIQDESLTVNDASGKTLGTLAKVERESPTLGAEPPKNATVLFDGSSAKNFEHGKLTEAGHLLAGCWSKQNFGDHKLHLEFRMPFKPYARGQARGNSGVYVQSRYEIQVLDSFGLEGKDNECGGIYSVARPKINACLPPLRWQTYDIDFTAARYKDGKKVENARVTVKHNGMVIHEDLELPKHTPGRHKEGPGPDALYLQGHGNPVVYRNIWVVEK